MTMPHTQLDIPAVLADGVSALAVHNGIVRIQLMRLGLDGKPHPSLELQLPVSAVKSVLDALKKVSGS
jgi:hypothetical protein